jgi:multiple sugar transport system permease protein
MNYVEIFIGKPFLLWFVTASRSLLATAIALPIATAMAYAFARFTTAARCSVGVLASRCCRSSCCCRCSAYSCWRSDASRDRHRASTPLPFLAFMLVTCSGDAAAGGGGEGRRRHPLAGLPPDRRAAAPGILAAGLGFILSWNEFLFALVLSGLTPRPAGQAGGARDACRRQIAPGGLTRIVAHRCLRSCLSAPAARSGLRGLK